MKKIFVLCLFILLLSGCGKGSTFEIELEGSSNSYYNWMYTVSDESVLKVVDEKYFGNENSDEIKRLDGSYVFTIQPLKKGKATIDFLYMLTWKESEVLYEYSVDLEVDNDLKIKKTAQSGNYLELVKFVDVGVEKLGLDGDFGDYKLIFDDDKIKVDKDECLGLTVYDYEDNEIGHYAISTVEDNIYREENDKMILIR